MKDFAAGLRIRRAPTTHGSVYSHSRIVASQKAYTSEGVAVTDKRMEPSL